MQIQLNRKIDDFKWESKNEAIQNLKYQHYLNRMKQTVMEVLEQRKIISRSAIGKQLIIHMGQKQDTHESSIDQQNLHEYNQTVGFLMQNQSNNQILKYDQILQNSKSSTNKFTKLNLNNDDSVDEFHFQMENECKRYNRIKLQKQRVAKEFILQEEQKLQISINNQKKFNNFQKFLQKKDNDLKELHQLKINQESHKKQKIKELKKQILQNQKDIDQQLKQKFIKAEQNLNDQSTNNNSSSVPRIFKENQAKEKFSILNQIQDSRVMQIKIQIYNKLENSQIKLKNFCTERQKRIIQKNQEVIEKCQQTQKLKSEQEQANVQQLINKIYEKQINLMKLEEKKNNNGIINKIQKEEKKNNAKQLQEEDESQWQQKMQQIKQRDQEIQEKMKQKAENQIIQKEINFEKKKLFDLDKQENILREQNKNEFKYQLIVKKKFKIQENLKNIKQKKQLLQSTRNLYDVKLNLEQNDINEKLQNLSQIFHKSQRTKSLVDVKKEGSQLLQNMFSEEVLNGLETKFFQQNKPTPIQQ